MYAYVVLMPFQLSRGSPCSPFGRHRGVLGSSNIPALHSLSMCTLSLTASTFPSLNSNHDQYWPSVPGEQCNIQLMHSSGLYMPYTFGCIQIELQSTPQRRLWYWKSLSLGGGHFAVIASKKLFVQRPTLEPSELWAVIQTKLES